MKTVGVVAFLCPPIYYAKVEKTVYYVNVGKPVFGSIFLIPLEMLLWQIIHQPEVIFDI